MNRCAVDRCGNAAWTTWIGHDVCKECSEAADAWNRPATTTNEAADVLAKIAANLRTHGTRYAPE